MSDDRFRTSSNVFEAEESETPFKNIQMSQAEQMMYEHDVPNGINESEIPSSSNLALMQSMTNISEGEIAVTRDALRFSVPIDFNLSGKKFSISFSAESSSGRGKLDYAVHAEDKSRLRVSFVEPGLLEIKQKGMIVTLDIESNKGARSSATLNYRPNLERTNDLVRNLDNVSRLIRETDLLFFVRNFPLFDSLGPINPKSILRNPAIVLRPTLKAMRIEPISIPSVQLEEGEAPSTFELVLKCGGGVVACALGAAATAGTGGLAIAAALAGCGVAGGECGILLAKYFEDKYPTPSPPPTFPFPTNTEPTSEPRTSNTMPVEIPPIVITAQLPAEKVRWIQAILKVANGESDLVVDGVMGPRTRDAIKRFQLRFGFTSDGFVTERTTTALIQLGLNEIAKQSRLGVDGIMGTRTKEETRNFQATHDSGPIDGIVGPLTRAAMIKALLPQNELEFIPSVV